jgi:hypothetical protein
MKERKEWKLRQLWTWREDMRKAEDAAQEDEGRCFSKLHP